MTEFEITKNVAMALSEVRGAIELAVGVCLVGASGSGKTSLVAILAESCSIGAANLLTIAVDDSFDAKDLLGKFSVSKTPGVFEWMPGPLTIAAREGMWLVVEDLDLASSDIVHFLSSVVSTRTLCISERGQTIPLHPSFRIIVTIPTGPVSPSGQMFLRRPVLPFDVWVTVLLRSPSRDEVVLFVLKRYPSFPVSLLESFCTSSFFSDTRKVMRWAARVCSRPGVAASCTLTSRQRDTAFLDACDCFVSCLPPSEYRDAAVKELAQCCKVPEVTAVSLLKHIKPTIEVSGNLLRLGRCEFVSTQIITIPSFAQTQSSVCLLERLLQSVIMNEAVLLTGETGVGKTFIVQTLAKFIGRRVVVHNISQQTDSSELIGAWRPVQPAILINDLAQHFFVLFGETFDVTKNERFMVAIREALSRQQWSRVVKLIVGGCRKASQSLDERQQQKDGLMGRWQLLSQSVDRFSDGRCDVPHFEFDDGSLVTAWKNGYWLLLDEVNLASAEILERLSSIIGSDAMFLVERGDTQPIPRHPDFRLFANMNPPTDVGKKDLPPNLRSRFVEHFVVDPFAPADLQLVAAWALNELVAEPPIDGTVNFFLDCVAGARTTLRKSDDERPPPHFSLRTFCRALQYVRTAAKIYGFKRAFIDGFMLAFSTSLSRQFHDHIQNQLLKLVGASPSLLMEHPPSASSPNSVSFEHVWLEMGDSPPPVGRVKLVRTRSVNSYLRTLATAVFAKHPVLLEGPTSAGKSTLVQFLAEATHHRFIRINNHESTDIQQYLGHYVSSESGGLRYVDGLLLSAVRHGHWVVLDELNLAPTDVLEALNRLLDDNAELFVPETQEVVKPHPQFRIFATQNPAGLYGGRRVLSRAFRNRFLEIIVDDIPPNEIKEIISTRFDLPTSFTEKMVDVMVKLQMRRQASHIFAGKHGYITTRDLVKWAERRPTTFQDLAVHGYLLLAERCRESNERQVVKDVIESVMRVHIADEIFEPTHWPAIAPYYQFLVEDPGTSSIVWTSSLKRLFTVAGICLFHREPVLLVGETGCSKTTVCQLWATALKQKLRIVNCHQHTEAADFVGALRPTRAGTNSKALFEWYDGPIVESMKDGALFLIDEISLADDSALERINSVLEPGRCITLVEKSTGDFVHAEQSFSILATMNPSGDFGKRELSPALRNRFTELYVPALVDASEVTSICRQRLPESLLRFAPTLGSLFDSMISSHCAKHISMRDVVSVIEFLKVVETRCVTSEAAFANAVDAVLLDGTNVGSLGATTASAEFQSEVKSTMRKLLRESDRADFDEYVNTPFWHVCRDVPDPSLATFFNFTAPTPRRNASKILRACEIKKAILLEGPPGVGKTTIVEALAKSLGFSIVRINLSEQTDMMDLIGTFLPADSTDGIGSVFRWCDGILLTAVKAGHWVILDELNLANQTVLEGLNSLLDHRRTLYITEMSLEVQAHANFKIFACQNPVLGGGGRKGLPRSFLNRFTTIQVEELTIDDIQQIVVRSFDKLPREICDSLVHGLSDIQRWISSRPLKGGPWECNLRDIARWATVYQHNPSPRTLAELGAAIISRRFRTSKDRMEAMRVLGANVTAANFGSVNDTPCILASATEICSQQGPIARRHNQPAEPSLPLNDVWLLLPQQAVVLRDMLLTVDDSHLIILTGPACSGKTALLRLAAWLTGNELQSLSLTPNSDAVDLLGGFDQVEGEQGTFRWRDSALLRAMIDGHWLVLDNANVCNPSVLDRLNSLAEPDGFLVLNEQGAVNGSTRIVHPHPRFKLFIEIDPRYGELSRALRNRGTELYCPPFDRKCPDTALVLRSRLLMRFPVLEEARAVVLSSIMLDFIAWCQQRFYRTAETSDEQTAVGAPSMRALLLAINLADSRLEPTVSLRKSLLSVFVTNRLPYTPGNDDLAAAALDDIVTRRTISTPPWMPLRAFTLDLDNAPCSLARSRILRAAHPLELNGETATRDAVAYVMIDQAFEIPFVANLNWDEWQAREVVGRVPVASRSAVQSFLTSYPPCSRADELRDAAQVLLHALSLVDASTDPTSCRLTTNSQSNSTAVRMIEKLRAFSRTGSDKVETTALIHFLTNIIADCTTNLSPVTVVNFVPFATCLDFLRTVLSDTPALAGELQAVAATAKIIEDALRLPYPIKGTLPPSLERGFHAPAASTTAELAPLQELLQSSAELAHHDAFFCVTEQVATEDLLMCLEHVARTCSAHLQGEPNPPPMRITPIACSGVHDVCFGLWSNALEATHRGLAAASPGDIPLQVRQAAALPLCFSWLLVNGALSRGVLTLRGWFVAAHRAFVDRRSRPLVSDDGWQVTQLTAALKGLRLLDVKMLIQSIIGDMSTTYQRLCGCEAANSSDVSSLIVAGSHRARQLQPLGVLDPAAAAQARLTWLTSAKAEWSVREKAFDDFSHLCALPPSAAKRHIRTILVSLHRLIERASAAGSGCRARLASSTVTFLELAEAIRQCTDQLLGDERLHMARHQTTGPASASFFDNWGSLLEQAAREMLQRFTGYEDFTVAFATALLEVAATARCVSRACILADVSEHSCVETLARLACIPRRGRCMTITPQLSVKFSRDAVCHWVDLVEALLEELCAVKGGMCSSELEAARFTIGEACKILDTAHTRESDANVVYIAKHTDNVIKTDDERQRERMRQLFPSFEGEFHSNLPTSREDAVLDNPDDPVVPAVEEQGKRASFVTIRLHQRNSSFGRNLVTAVLNVYSVVRTDRGQMVVPVSHDGTLDPAVGSRLYDAAASLLHQSLTEASAATGFESGLLCGTVARCSKNLTGQDSRSLGSGSAFVQFAVEAGVNVYQEAVATESFAAIDVLKRVQARVGALETQFPDSGALFRIQVLVKRVARLPLDSTPLMKLSAGFEVLLRELYDWERDASPACSVLPLIDAASVCVLRWRRMELHSWKHLFEARFQLHVANCVPIWQRLISAVEADSEPQTIVKISGDILWSAPLGQFRTRVALVGAAGRHFLSVSGARVNDAGHALVNVESFFEQFLPIVDRKIKESIDPLKAELEQFAAAMKWEDATYYAVRASTEKSHSTVARVLSKLDDALMLPAVSTILAHETALDEGKIPSPPSKPRERSTKRTRRGTRKHKGDAIATVEQISAKEDVEFFPSLGCWRVFAGELAIDIEDEVASLQQKGTYNQKQRALKMLLTLLEEHGVFCKGVAVSASDVWRRFPVLAVSETRHFVAWNTSAVSFFEGFRGVQRVKDFRAGAHQDIPEATQLAMIRSVDSLLSCSLSQHVTLATIAQSLTCIRDIATVLQQSVSTAAGLETVLVESRSTLLTDSRHAAAASARVVSDARRLCQLWWDASPVPLDVVEWLDLVTQRSQELREACALDVVDVTVLPRETCCRIVDLRRRLSQAMSVHSQALDDVPRRAIVDAFGPIKGILRDGTSTFVAALKPSRVAQGKRERADGDALPPQGTQWLDSITAAVDGCRASITSVRDQQKGGDTPSMELVTTLCTTLPRAAEAGRAGLFHLAQVDTPRMDVGDEEAKSRTLKRLSELTDVLQNCLNEIVASTQSHDALVKRVARLFAVLLQKGFCKSDKEDDQQDDGSGDEGDGAAAEGTGMDDGKGDTDVTDQLENEDQLMNMKDMETPESGDDDDREDAGDNAAEVTTDFQGQKEDDDDDGSDADSDDENQEGEVDPEHRREKKKMRTEKQDPHALDDEEGGAADEVEQDEIDNESQGSSERDDGHGNKEDEIKQGKEEYEKEKAKKDEGDLLDQLANGQMDDDSADASDTGGDSDADGSNKSDSDEDETEDEGNEAPDEVKDPEEEQADGDAKRPTTEEEVPVDEDADAEPANGDEDPQGGSESQSGSGASDDGDDADKAGRQGKEADGAHDDMDGDDQEQPEGGEGAEDATGEQQEQTDTGRSWQATSKEMKSNRKDTTKSSKRRPDPNPYERLSKAMLRQQRKQADAALNLQKEAVVGDDTDNDDDTPSADLDNFERHEKGKKQGLAPADVPPNEDADAEEPEEKEEADPEGGKQADQRDGSTESNPDDSEREDNSETEENADAQNTKRRVSKKKKAPSSRAKLVGATHQPEDEPEAQPEVSGDDAMIEARRSWQEDSVAVASLAHQLCERLRVMLDPTVADKLQGDYKTGKRLSIKRIIPFIASNFKKDKIWLRRTKPSKRAYQVLIALDDSKSMMHNRAAEVARQAVALLCKGLTQLQIGEFAIMSFGAQSRVIHDMQCRFSEEHGPGIYANLSFSQPSTSLRQLLTQSLSYLDAERQRAVGNIRSTTTQMMQLMFVITDGHITENRMELRKLVATAESNRQAIVLILLDLPEASSGAAESPGPVTAATTDDAKPLSEAAKMRLRKQERERRLQRQGASSNSTSNSVLEMQVVEFTAANKVVKKPYLEDFPFAFYLVVQDLARLPEMLGDAMRQWFEVLSLAQ